MVMCGSTHPGKCCTAGATLGWMCLCLHPGKAALGVNRRNTCLMFVHLIYFCLFRRHDVISSNAMSKVDVNLNLADNVFVWILWWRVGGV